MNSLSDRLKDMFQWAVELIKKDLAYVCHQRVEEMRGFDVQMSPWRNRPIAESLQLFQVSKTKPHDANHQIKVFNIFNNFLREQLFIKLTIFFNSKMF